MKIVSIKHDHLNGDRIVWNTWTCGKCGFRYRAVEVSAGYTPVKFDCLQLGCYGEACTLGYKDFKASNFELMFDANYEWYRPTTNPQNAVELAELCFGWLRLRLRSNAKPITHNFYREWITEINRVQANTLSELLDAEVEVVVSKPNLKLFI